MADRLSSAEFARRHDLPDWRILIQGIETWFVAPSFADAVAFIGEIADAAASLAVHVVAGRVRPAKVDERTLARYLYNPDLPEVDLFVRSSGEQRTSNFLPWQAAYAELVFLDTLWPDFDRRDLWRAVEAYARRDRRYGGAQ